MLTKAAGDGLALPMRTCNQAVGTTPVAVAGRLALATTALAAKVAADAAGIAYVKQREAQLFGTLET
ncbi:hypothetical protein [Pandoraea terrigena]|uniref:Uncharacterized protein n=1 Tax=Pandoraea terrigena TaxID=2508292 RepID=A0A5E4WNT3_9BURK|nr:hypothetical protein [Pandoraea terrigena]VVE26191.1 hypothetical protein PTE31013_03427 [Pandoraea terrigena]